MISLNLPHESTRVINSRPSKKRPVVWRRRQGSSSGTTFTTYERPSLAENKKITLPNGATTTFNLGRLIISISHSFTHNADAAKNESLWLAQTIEDTLSMKPEELTTKSIAETTYEALKRFDQLAAIQYAAKHKLISNVRRRGRPPIALH